MATGKYLLDQLGVKAPMFGVAYSVINTAGLLKGVSLSRAGITKLAGKLLEDGHATTFMIEGGNITMTGYENCISSSHMIVHKMGFGSAVATKGFWIPSISNWATWTATKFSAWKYKALPNMNTHIS